MRQSTVFVVDDHAAVRDALLTLLDSVGIDAVGFDTGESFLEQLNPDHAGCALLDVRMPGVCGLVLAREMRELGSELPVVFISGHGDVRLAVEAMRLGAEDFIEKPFRDQDVIDRVQRCLELDCRRHVRLRNVHDVRERLRTLTVREQLVLDRIVCGEPNKEIAVALNLSTRTIESHRAHVMKKMQAPCLATLVRMVTTVQVTESVE